MFGDDLAGEIYNKPQKNNYQRDKEHIIQCLSRLQQGSRPRTGIKENNKLTIQRARVQLCVQFYNLRGLFDAND